MLEDIFLYYLRSHVSLHPRRPVFSQAKSQCWAESELSNSLSLPSGLGKVNAVSQLDVLTKGFRSSTLGQNTHSQENQINPLPAKGRTPSQVGRSVTASLVAQAVKNLSVMQQPRFDSWIGKIPWRRKWQLTPVYSPWRCQESDQLRD